MTRQRDPAGELGERDSEGQIFRADTVPPPASGDAYSAATVVREAPPEMLAAIRERKKLKEASAKPDPRSDHRHDSSAKAGPRVAPVVPLQLPPEPKVPRFNFHVEDEDQDRELDWDVPPMPSHVAQEEPASERSDSGSRPIQYNQAAQRRRAAIQRDDEWEGLPTQEEGDGEEYAVTMLSVSPRSSRPNAGKAVRVSSDILGPSTSVADADDPANWQAPLAPANRWPRWLRILFVALVLGVLLMLASAPWSVPEQDQGSPATHGAPSPTSGPAPHGRVLPAVPR
jgi:hypothetical protein